MDREWRRGRRWHPCCPRHRTRCRDTDESSRAPDAASGTDPPIRPAQFVGPWRKRRVSHHVEAERFDKRDARILAAAAAIRPPLVIRFWLQRNAEPLDARWVAGLIKSNSCDADARIIALRDQPWEEVKLTIRAANGSRIQDAFGLKRIARLRLHHQPKALQLKSTHQSRLEQSALFCPIRIPTLLKISRHRLRKSFLIVAMCPARRNHYFCVNEEHLLESDRLASQSGPINLAPLRASQ